MESLRRLAARLPGGLMTVLEVRLGPDPASTPAGVDLSLRLAEPRQAPDLAGIFPSAERVLSLWAAQESPLAPVRSLWLEFDHDRTPDPILCAKLAPGASLPWLTGTLFPALHGAPLPESQEALVRRCVEAIPPPAYLLYAFSLRPRGGDVRNAVRLEIFGLDPAGILAYLERVAPDAVPWIAEPASRFEGVERIHLSLDIAEEILPRIGIEGSFSRLPSREPGWRTLLDRLCRPEERDAALAWPGSDTFWTAPSSWPASPTGGSPGGRCVRMLSHVKAVCRPGRAPETKLYLMFTGGSG